MSSTFPRLCYGHRGAPAERPENTIEGFQYALDCGVDALETDVHMTRDGHIVVHHDDTGLRSCGVALNIRDSTLQQVQQWDAGYGYSAPDGTRPFAGKGIQIPTLEAVLEQFPDTFFNVDIKQPTPAMVVPTMVLLKAMGAVDRVRLASVQDATIKSVRMAGYAGPTGIGKAEVLKWYFTPSLLAPRLSWQGHERALQIPTKAGPFHLDTVQAIEKAHRCQWRVDFWTINTAAEAQRLLALGADGIMTDDPAKIVPAVRAAER